MKSNRSIVYPIAASFIFFLCILDSKTVLSGAKIGLDLCIQSAIPSLFPFLVLSKILCSTYQGHSISIVKRIGRVIGIPDGSEHLLIMSILGGYPVGAHSIYDAYAGGSISQNTAKRLLAFCNNAGPAFIFGMLPCLFSSNITPWIIWIIHIASSVLVGFLLPNKHIETAVSTDPPPMVITNILNTAIKSMVLVCGWIIIFRIIIQIAQRWFLWLIPQPWNSLIIGMLELSNGCFALSNINSESIRFVCASVIVSFGGCCVWMQTSSVVKELGTDYYICGKILQASISLLFALVVQCFMFINHVNAVTVFCLIIIILLFIAFIFKQSVLKKTVAI